MTKLTNIVVGAVLGAAASIPAAASADVPKTVVLVHGAFADGSSWSKVIPLLEAKGLRVVAVQNPLSSLADDVAATRRAIELAPGKVILVGHSWGGVVITQAGIEDKVKALVYVAAFALPAGASVNSSSAGAPPLPWLKELVPDSAGYVRLSEKAVAHYFAQDLEPAEIAIVAATQGPTFAGAFDDKLTEVAYTSRPSWYVLSTADGMIPPLAQEAMATAIKANITKIDASHVVMLSHPDEVAQVIIDAADSVK